MILRILLSPKGGDSADKPSAVVLGKPESSPFGFFIFKITIMISSQPLSYIAYLRKSSEAEDRQALSIESQEAELRSVIASERLRVADTIRESHSAKERGKRPLFNEMIERIERGEANAILLWNVNRLSRNAGDTGTIIDLMDRGKLLEVRTINQTFRNDPNHKFLLNLFCSQAKLENDNKGVDVKRGLKRKAEMGWHPGTTRVGYKNTPDRAKGFKIIVKDEERFPLVQKMFRMVVSCEYSASRVLEIATEKWGLRKENGKPLSRSAWYNMLSDPFFYGEFEYPEGSGQWHRGAHEPMIGKDEHVKLQAILGNRRGERRQRHEFPFTGLLVCGECGQTITAEYRRKVQINGTVHLYTHYHCVKKKDAPKCGQSVVHEHDLDSQIADIVGSIALPAETVAWAMGVIRKENTINARVRDDLLETQRKNYDRCLAKIDALIDMRAGGEITEEEFARKKTGLSEEKKRLQNVMENIDADAGDWLRVAEESFDFASRAGRAFAETKNPARKKEIARTLCSNLSLKDGKVAYILEKPFPAIQKMKKILDAEKARVRTAENGSAQKENEPLWARCPGMLRR